MSLFQTVLPSVWVQLDRATAAVAGWDWTRHALRDSLSQAFETPVSSKCPTVVHLLQRLVFFLWPRSEAAALAQNKHLQASDLRAEAATERSRKLPVHPVALPGWRLDPLPL